MSQVISSILCILFAFLPGVCHARPEAKPPRVLYIKGIIVSQSMEPVQKQLDSWVSSGDNQEVILVINSPGGEVTSVVRFINSMLTARAVGIKLKCYVTDMAASMAFQIFTQCTERHALATSFLLWHGVRAQIGQPITAALAKSLAEDMSRLDELIRYQLDSALNLDDEQIDHHFQAETLWSGLVLHEADPKFMQIAVAFPELVVPLAKAVTTSQGIGFLFGNSQSGISNGADIIYIWRKYFADFPINGGK